jgi:CubicO group peptidase (beta-lactamase class C family)
MEKTPISFARKLAPLVLATLALALPAASAAAPAQQPACWPALPQGWQGAMLVSQNGNTIARADGTADGRPLTPSTRFNIASLGKMFTAVAIGQLVDDGRLGFGDPVGRHLPELPPAFHGLTIAQLLSHTAGLGDYLSEASPDVVAKARTATDLVPLVVAHPPQGVGTWAYSNSGYALAGAIVERLTGQTLQAALQERVFEPAGMHAVGFSPAPADALPTETGADGRSTHSLVGQLPAGPPGGHFTTVEDLSRFGTALLAGTLLKPETLARMSTIFVERHPPGEDGQPRGWGLGFAVTGAGKDRMFGHVGGVPGGGAAMRLLPGRGRIAVVLANQDKVPTPPLASQLLSMDITMCAANR